MAFHVEARPFRSLLFGGDVAALLQGSGSITRSVVVARRGRMAALRAVSQSAAQLGARRLSAEGSAHLILAPYRLYYKCDRDGTFRESETAL